jgi:trigger factor
LLKSCEDVSATRKRITIEVPVDVIESEIQKKLVDTQSKTRIPGFRPGKAPLSMVEKKFGKSVESEVVDKAISDEYKAAVRESGFKPMMHPKIEQEVEFKRNEPLTVTFTVEVRPAIENLDYENIAVEEVPVEMTDEEVEAVMKSFATAKGTYEVVDDAAAAGDLVVVDFRTDGGVEKKDVVIQLGAGPFPKEFFDAFTGRKKDEAFEAEAAFPADSQSEFAGNTVKFSITLKEVKRNNVPPVDDELAKDMGLESVEAMRTQVKADMLALKHSDVNRKQQNEILDKILDANSFEAPEGLVTAELARLVSQAKASGKKNGADEELEKELRPEAEKNARAVCVFDIVGEKEGVEVTEDDMKREIYQTAMRYNVTPDTLIKHYIERDGSLEGIRNAIFDRKTMKVLLEKARKRKE